MSQVPPRRLRSHRRPLPWDVLAQIFQQADTSTLATLGRVSFDFLVATSSLLYKEVEVTTVKQLEALFCERKQSRKVSSSPSRINPHLDLTQLRSLSFDFLLVCTPSKGFSRFRLSSSRFSESASLLLGSLLISYHHDNRDINRELHASLFPLLNPTRMDFRLRGRPSFWGPWYETESAAISELEGWTRLDLLVCKGAISYPVHGKLRHSSHGAVRIDLPSLLSTKSNTLTSVVRHLNGSHYTDVDEVRAGSVVLVVHQEDEREETLKAIEGLPEMMRQVLLVEIEA